MPLTGDVEIKQNGIVVSARVLTNADPMDVALVDGSGNQLTGFDPSRPATSTLSQASVTTVSSVVLAANPARRKFLLFNGTGKTAFVAFAGVASITAYTVSIPVGGLFESSNDSYTGVVSAITSSGTSTLQVTEITT